MAVAPNVGHGLAYVSRELDISPFRDGGWTNEHMNDAVVLPLGQKVLTLPADVGDNGWQPVVFLDEDEFARFGWTHPQCIELVNYATTEVVTVGHTDKRGCDWPSHDIGPARIHGLGFRIYKGLCVLDARYFVRRSERYPPMCGGFCKVVVHDIASDWWAKMGDK